MVNRKEIILNRLSQGENQTQIGKELGVSRSTISYEIRKMDPKEVEEAINEGKRIRQEAILEGLRQGKTQTQIAKELGLSVTTISTEISQMDQKEVEAAKLESRKIIREAILEGLRQGKTQTQIAKELGIIISAISVEISKMDQAEVKAAILEGKKPRRKAILEGLSQGKTQTQIAKELGLSVSTISVEISEMDPKEVEAAKEEGEKIREAAKLEKLRQQKTNTYIDKEKELSVSTTSAEIPKMEPKKAKEVKSKTRKVNAQIITIEDVKQYQEKIEESYDKVSFKEILLMINSYVKMNQISEAIRFLNLLIDNEDMKYLGLDKLTSMKQELEITQKKQRERNLIRDKISGKEIAKEVEPEEFEVIQIKNEIESGKEREIC